MKGGNSMDYTVIMQSIGSLGFPIAMCLAMFFYMIKQNELHKTEIDRITEALNNNTIALNRLHDKMGVGDK